MDIFSGQALWRLKGAVAIHAGRNYPSEVVETEGITEPSNFKRDYSCLSELARYRGFPIGNLRPKISESCLPGFSPKGLSSPGGKSRPMEVIDSTSPAFSKKAFAALSKDSTSICLRTISQKRKLNEMSPYALPPPGTLRDNNSKDRRYDLLSRESRPHHFHS